MNNEYDDLEKQFTEDPYRDLVNIEIEPEPNFQEEEVQLGELNYPGSQTEYIVEYEEDDVKAIISLAEESYQEYVKNQPNFRDLEGFLKTLPPEMASDIRVYAKENNMYGNHPLEMSLIQQYGVIIQARSFNKAERNFDKRLRDIVVKNMYVFDSGIDRKIKEFNNSQNKAVKAIEKSANKIIANNEAREQELADIHESMKQVIFDDKENMLLELRNDLLDPIKSDINGIAKNINKTIEEAAYRAFKRVEKERKDTNFTWLLSTIIAGGFISVVGGVMFCRFVGLLH
ncbi:hypothetical protein [Burkholderia contaminans]|uniref:hypothetical protein n=1 Tax=Burkholderia contaminans TaxID=488447 RepID=UPI00158E0F5B|nr:hypothetical protein [Burkholderia contaminans]